MRDRRFIQCDVFSEVPGRGNALAVVLDAEGMDDEAMQRFAQWTNLAETTFLFAPSDPAADYRVRIFTPGREMPFAGHPTLGSCAAWLKAGGRPKRAGVVVQDCAVGLVEIRQDGPTPAFVAPPTRIAPMDPAERARIGAALGLDETDVKAAVELDNGPVWQLLELGSAEAVLAADESRTRWPEFRGVSLLGRHPGGGAADYEVRNISPSSGMSEDPITGSLNAAIGHWLARDGRLGGGLVMAQGTKIGRLGRVTLSPGAAPGELLVGGATSIVIEGTVRI